MKPTAVSVNVAPPVNDPSYRGRVTVLTSGRPATLLRPRVRYRPNGEAIPEWEVRLHADGRVFRVRATEAMRGLQPMEVPASETAPGTVTQVLGIGGKRHAMVALDAWGRTSCCAVAAAPVAEGSRVLVQRVACPVDRFDEGGWEYVVVSVAPGATR